MNIFHRLHSEERGVAIVLVAVMLLVLMGLGALAIDTGMVMWNRGALQNAVDAAALAGVRELPHDPVAAETVARTYMAENFPGLPAENVEVEIPPTGRFNEWDSIIVSASNTVGPGLRGAVGNGDIDVPAMAEAIVAKSVPMCEIWPWGVGAVDFDGEYGVPIALKVTPGDKYVSGNFGALDLDGHSGGGTGDYIDRVKNKGCLTDLTVIPEKGNMGKNNFDAVVDDADSVLKQCMPKYNWQYGVPIPHCVDWANTDGPPLSLGCPAPGGVSCGKCTEAGAIVHVPSCSRVGIVPIIKEFKKLTGHETFEIVDFAAFYLIGVELDKPNQTSQPTIIGAFLETVTVEGGTPMYGLPLNGPVGYFLWR